jgi:hypothetical protein
MLDMDKPLLIVTDQQERQMKFPIGLEVSAILNGFNARRRNWLFLTPFDMAGRDKIPTANNDRLNNDSPNFRVK